MIKKTLPLLVCTLLFGIFFSNAEGQIKKVGQTSMKWLSIPVGARSTSMGNSYYSMSGSVENIFWNPAGVGFVDSHELYVSHLTWIADINQSAGAVSLSFGSVGVFTFSIRYVDFGDIQGTRLSNNEEGWELTGNFNPAAYQVGIGYSNRMSESFAYGILISYAKENLGTVEFVPVLGGSSEQPVSEESALNLLNVDFGVIYYTGFHDLRLGMTLKNFSQEKGYGNVDNPVPMDLHYGLAMDLLKFYWENNQSHNVTFAIDFSHPRDYTERIHMGLEYIFQETFALRVGYMTNYDEQNFTFGAGLLPKFGIGGINLGLDYAFIPFGVFDYVHTFGFTVRL